MAANKFATMLHNKTNKITLILIYAILEWILIILLLLNSLFSYLIMKFADYFGLQRPCLWCSRVDHILEPENSNFSYRDLVCETHASEISRLGYCSNHRKLAESQNMCEDCSSSSHSNCRGTAKITFMIQDGGEKVIENGETNLKCSCCEVSLESKYYSPYFLIKPSWGVLDYTQKGNLIMETGVDDEIEEGDNSDQSRSDFVIDRCDEEQGNEENRGIEMVSDVNGGNGKGENEAEDVFFSESEIGRKETIAGEDNKVDLVLERELEPLKEDTLNVSTKNPSCDHTLVQVCEREDASLEILPQHLEFYIDNDDFRLIPVELIDSTTAENQIEQRLSEGVQRNSDNQEAVLDSELQEETGVEFVEESMCNSGETGAVLSANERKEESKAAVLERVEFEFDEDENSLVFHAEGRDFVPVPGEYEEVAVTHATQNPLNDVPEKVVAATEEVHLDSLPASKEAFQLQNDETDVVISIGTEIPDQEQISEIRTEEILPSNPGMEDDSFVSFDKFPEDDDHGAEQIEEEKVQCKTISVEPTEQTLNNHLSMSSELNEIEEDRFPDTPTSVDHLHKKLLLLEKRESGTEESLDGSVISEFEAGEGVPTVERLKSALRAERKALNALYTELEEERSASAVAANQTMAMISRLQEEKAAMQMEALQYQRMMEEQSEYDQEALQLLNELMIKREKEKQELEKELEIYRKKIIDYETKEKVMMLRRMKDGSTRSRTSTASCSNAEDSDGLSIDLNHEGKEEESFYSQQESGHHNTPVDAVLNLEESLANFEDERISILEQLKVLEEKLFSLADEEERHMEDMKPFEQFYEENGKEFDENFDLCTEESGAGNGFSKETNGKLSQEQRNMVKAKRLLPLFDAIGAEIEDGVVNGNGEGFDSIISQPQTTTKFELETKKLAIDEEVDNLYERLQALEADRDFLKHCMSSLKKGDKGTDLLQEILQHLRDLRNVELRVRNISDGAPL